MKRLFDITIILLLSPFLFLILLIISLLVRFNLGSPVFYRQLRPGLNGKIFNIIKFRSMTDLRDSAGNLLPDEERLTKFGKYLRSSSLDELPEVWNVLAGDMSLVGPRPLLVEYMPLYSAEQARRHEVRPGITGWAQINGRNAISWEDKFKLDVWYVDNWSISLDLLILTSTLNKVLSREGISAENHVTTKPFEGSA